MYGKKVGNTLASLGLVCDGTIVCISMRMNRAGRWRMDLGDGAACTQMCLTNNDRCGYLRKLIHRMIRSAGLNVWHNIVPCSMLTIVVMTHDVDLTVVERFLLARADI